MNRLRYQIPAFIAVRLGFSTAHRMIYPFLSHFARGLGVDLQAMSYILTVRSLMGFFGPFLSSIADSRGRKTGMLFGMFLLTAGMLLVVILPSYPTFFLALVLNLVGYLIFIPSMQAYLGDQVPYERRGRVLGLTELSWSLSAIIGIPLVGLIISRHGWLAPFPLLVVLGVLSLALLSWLLPRDPAPSGNRPGVWTSLRRVFTYPPALAGLFMVAFYSAANEVVNFVYGIWIEADFNLTIASLGAAALTLGLAELLGEGLVTAITDRLGKRRAVALGIILNCLAALSLPIFSHWLPGALAGLFFFYLTFEFTVVSGIPLMTEIMPSARATLMAAHISIISLGRAISDALAPVLFTHPLLGGITTVALAAVAFNLLALFALRRVVIEPSLPAPLDSQPVPPQ